MVPSFFSRNNDASSADSAATLSEQKNDTSTPQEIMHNSEVRASKEADLSASERESNSPAVSSEQDPQKTRTPAQRFADAVTQWQEDLRGLTKDRSGENLPNYFLGNAHPGGLAQLYAQHPTRLENLVRESGAYKRALEGARRIIGRQRQLAAQHGVANVHLAVGHVSWLSNDVKQSSPALLRKLVLDDDGSDIVLTLGARVQIAPALVHVAAQHGIDLDVVQLRAEAMSGSSFSPLKAMNYIKERCSSLNGFELRDELAMGIYEHPATALLNEYDAKETLAQSAIVRALAGDEAVLKETTLPLDHGNPQDRDPWKERGIGDLTPRQHDLIEAMAAGRSFVIRSTQANDATVANAIVAEAAAKGRTTIYVAGNRSRLLHVQEEMDNAGIGGAVVRIDGSATDGEQLRQRLIQALESDLPSFQTDRDVDAMREDLRAVRQTLTNYTQQLHAPFAQFGVSAMDALQVLTEITSRTSAPRTKIRLREDILHEIAQDQGESARALLHHADELGMFTRASVHSAWTGAVIDAPEQVAVVVAAVKRLATDSLPQMRNAVERISQETQIAPALTIRQWQAQLDMLEGVREALDVFRPAVFERSAADMVIATAPARWRKERGIAMKRSQRVRLVKHAKDLLIPGRHVEDLHRELVLVQEKRDVWRRFSNADGWPVLPSGLLEAMKLTAVVVEDIEVITPAMSTGYENLMDMNLAELQRLMDRFAADPEGAELLPQRVRVLKDAAEMGIDQLVTDLRRRHVTGEMIDAELDLAWWASILGVILASNSAFHGLDPANLFKLLRHGRELDAQQVQTLLPQALENIQRRRQHILSARADQYTQIREFLDRQIHDAAELYARSGLVSALVPTVLTLPALIPVLLPAGKQVDLLVLDDISQIPLAALVPVLARARQVIVLSQQMPTGAVDALCQVLPVVEVPPAPSRLNDQVVRLLAHYGMPHAGIPQPWAMRAEPLNAVWVEASGLPTPGTNAVSSTLREVETVMDIIIDHALQTPERSLAVIAMNPIHAERIREAVARTLSQEVGLRDFFNPSKVEPFVVADLTQASGLSRDRIIIAVGFAKTPHGRVMHDFGPLSQSEGADLMAAVLRTVRDDLTIISAIHPGEVDHERLFGVGAHMLMDLLALAEGQTPIAPGSWPVLEAEPDSLLIDLAERLYSMGLEVIPNVGVEGGRRIPLAIGHPSVPGRLLVAVLTDDAEYVAEPSLRVRDRLWPEMLREQGWQVFMAMSLSVFIDPAAVAEQIVNVVLDEVERIHAVAAPAKVVESEPMPIVSELAPEEQAALDATNDARARHDEALTGMIQIIANEEQQRFDPELLAGMGWADSSDDETSSRRGPRPPIARGLPLAAYGDDQLDELALWVRSDGVERSHEELVEELRHALGLMRRGTQTDAVLSNVIRRTRSAAVVPEEDVDD